MNTEIKSKVCTKCKEEKALEEFGRDKSRKDGRQSECKVCRKAYYKANREQILAKQKAYQEANKENRSEYSKAYREANKEKIAAKKKAYREANKQVIAAWHKEWYEANKDKIAEYRKKRYVEDPVFRTMNALRAQTGRLGNYKSESTIQIVGCSPQEFWKRNGSPSVEQLQDLHIDHIVPLSWFDLSNEDHLAVSSHHSNLQYLSSEDNMAKGNSYAGTPDNIIAYKDDLDIEAYVTDMLALINIL